MVGGLCHNKHPDAPTAQLYRCCVVQDAYYRAVATLQSNQLRSMVQKSLDSYVSFFTKHEPVMDVSGCVYADA